MPLDLQIIRAREFIRLGPHGHLNLAASKQILAELARACRLRAIDRAMVDVRDVKTELTPDELAELVRAFEDVGFTRSHRLALLHRGDQDHRARTFALIGKLRGWKLQAFGSFEEAILWLSANDRSKTNPATQGTPIPIRRVSAAARPVERRTSPSQK